MSIRDLVSLVSPPVNPVATGSSKVWARIQNDVGVQLPTEMFDLASLYGSGRFFDGFLHVYNPFASNYRKLIDSELEWLRMIQKRGLEYGVFPQAEGLFPWGRDENGDSYCWLTKGTAETWSIFVLKHAGDELTFEMGIVEFLVKAMRNKIRLWAEDVSSEELVFIPEARSNDV